MLVAATIAYAGVMLVMGLALDKCLEAVNNLGGPRSEWFDTGKHLFETELTKVR